jgi:hypothetical protein
MAGETSPIADLERFSLDGEGVPLNHVRKPSIASASSQRD